MINDVVVSSFGSLLKKLAVSTNSLLWNNYSSFSRIGVLK